LYLFIKRILHYTGRIGWKISGIFTNGSEGMMERKWLAALLPLTMMGAVSLAVNPFEDVTPDDWA